MDLTVFSLYCSKWNSDDEDHNGGGTGAYHVGPEAERGHSVYPNFCWSALPMKEEERTEF